MTYKRARCPHCDTILIHDEVPDTQWMYGCYTDIVRGCCPTCHRQFIWQEHYTLTSIDNIAEGIYEPNTRTFQVTDT